MPVKRILPLLTAAATTLSALSALMVVAVLPAPARAADSDADAPSPLVLVYSERTATSGTYPAYEDTFAAAQTWLGRFFRYEVISDRDVEAGKLVNSQQDGLAKTSPFKLAILPDNAIMTAAEAKAWAEFVAAGGKIIAVSSTSVRDENKVLTTMRLGDLLGVWWKQYLPTGSYKQIRVTDETSVLAQALAQAGAPTVIEVEGTAQMVEVLDNGKQVAVRANAEGVKSFIYPAAVVESPAGLYFGLPVFDPQVLAWPDLQQALYAVIKYYVPEAVKKNEPTTTSTATTTATTTVAATDETAAFTPLTKRELFAKYMPAAEMFPQLKVVDRIPGEVPPATSYRIFPGAYYRKAVSSFDLWTGIEGVVTLPELITDPAREDSRRPLDNASIYMGGNGSGQEIDAGLTWDNNVGGWRPFWRNEKWANAPLVQDLFVWYPGETVRMSVVVAGPGKLRLTIQDEGPDPQKAFTTVFDAWGFGPGVRQQFKRVNAIDQVGNEGKPVQPTKARVTAAVWKEVWLWRRDVKVPFTAERFTDMRAPNADHFVIGTPAAADGQAAGPGAELIEIYGDPAARPAQ